MRVTLAVSAIALSVAALSATSSANAATAESCALHAPDVTTLVTPTSACFVLIGTDGNVSNDIGEFNATAFGGFSDWQSLGKIDLPGLSSANFSITANSALVKGTWAIFDNATTALFDTFALVFKAGQDGNTDPASQVGYILSGTSGDWEAPLFNYNSNRDKFVPRGLSHVSLYARTTDTPPPPPPPVPVPAAGWLMLAGIVGLVAARRRDA